jgi:hypothetical protein
MVSLALRFFELSAIMELSGDFTLGIEVLRRKRNSEIFPVESAWSFVTFSILVMSWIICLCKCSIGQFSDH